MHKIVFYGGLLVALLFSQLSFAFNSRGEITNAKIASCGNKICFKINGSHAFVGGLVGTIAIDNAKVLFFKHSSNKPFAEYSSDDVIYDPYWKIIYIKEIKNSPVTGAIFYIDTEELREFR